MQAELLWKSTGCRVNQKLQAGRPPRPEPGGSSPSNHLASFPVPVSESTASVSSTPMYSLTKHSFYRNCSQRRAPAGKATQMHFPGSTRRCSARSGDILACRGRPPRATWTVRRFPRAPENIPVTVAGRMFSMERSSHSATRTSMSRPPEKAADSFREATRRHDETPYHKRFRHRPSSPGSHGPESRFPPRPDDPAVMDLVDPVTAPFSHSRSWLATTRAIRSDFRMSTMAWRIR